MYESGQSIATSHGSLTPKGPMVGDILQVGQMNQNNHKITILLGGPPLGYLKRDLRECKVTSNDRASKGQDNCFSWLWKTSTWLPSLKLTAKASEN